MDISEKGEVIFLSDTFAYSYDEPGRLAANDKVKVHQIAPGVICGSAGFVNAYEYVSFQRLLEGKNAFQNKLRIISALEEKLSQRITLQEKPSECYAFGMCDGNKSTIYYADNKNGVLKARSYVMIGSVYPDVIKHFDTERKAGVETKVRLERAYKKTARMITEDKLWPIGGMYSGRLDKETGIISPEMFSQ